MKSAETGNRSRLARAVTESEGPLLGIAAYFYDPVFVEIAAKLGFRVLWIEMEHAFISFAQAADLCRIASVLKAPGDTSAFPARSTTALPTTCPRHNKR